MLLVPGAKPDPATVTRQFLADMSAAAKKTFPLWLERLKEGLEEEARGSAAVADILSFRPIEDFYFAGVVGMEAARISHYLPADITAKLLTSIGDQVDAAAGRSDRIVSDVVFVLIGRIEAETGIERMRMPYDLTVRVLLERLGLAEAEALRPLLHDIYFLHNLGEPLARGIPAWWKRHAPRLKTGEAANSNEAKPIYA